MLKPKRGEVWTAGSSLESCLAARILADSGSIDSVTYIVTGDVGGCRCDEGGTVKYGFFPLERSAVDSILKVMPNERFISSSNRKVKVPHDGCPITNSYNGEILFPLTRASFEDYDEWEEVRKCTDDYDGYLSKAIELHNAPQVLKKMYSKPIYESIVKRIAVNLWSCRQGMLDPRFLFTEAISVESINDKIPVEFYVPVSGFTELSKSLLDHKKINVVYGHSRESVRGMVRSRNRMFYLYDDVDYYLDYVFGMMECVKFTSTEIGFSADTSITYDICSKTSCATYSYMGKKYTMKSSKTSYDEDTCKVVAPTVGNIRSYAGYAGMAAVLPSVNILI